MRLPQTPAAANAVSTATAQDSASKMSRGKLCRRCNKDDHVVADCPLPSTINILCRVCEELGHKPSTYPQQQCRKCLGKGHNYWRRLSSALCQRCHESGHTSISCSKPPPKCADCNGPHKTEKCRNASTGNKQGKQYGDTKLQSVTRVTKGWRKGVEAT